MPRYIRPRAPGATIFFTVALASRTSDLLVSEIDRLRASVRQTLSARPLTIDAWVVLPDHLHCVWTLPDGDRDFSTRWGAIKGRFSNDLRRAGLAPPRPALNVRGGANLALRKGQAGLWQERFWEHHIRDQRDRDLHVSYCLNDPVKHGLVKRTVDWPFSSIHRDIRLGRIEADCTGAIAGGDFGEP